MSELEPLDLKVRARFSFSAWHSVTLKETIKHNCDVVLFGVEALMLAVIELCVDTSK